MSGLSAVVLTVIASLLSGLVGSVATIFFVGRIESRKLKIDTLRRLLGNRSDLASREFVCAANEVLVVFRDHPKVLAALRNLHQVASTPGKPNIDDALVSFLKEASVACRLSPVDLSDTAFLQVFVETPKS
jgi:hypothetical protein